MIEAIKEIGEYALKKEGKNINQPLDILIDDPESNPNKRTYKNILIIVLERINENYVYKRVELEEYSEDKLKKYLYKQGEPSGTDLTPTSRVTSIEGTFNRKILAWFDKGFDITKLNQENTDFLTNLRNCIQNNKQKILEDLKKRQNSLDKKENSILTLKIDGNYIGEHEIFQTILIERAKENFYFKYKKTSKSKNQICSICKKRKSEVYGFVSTYPFYTVDKRGFVSGGFQQDNAWKNYPVCLNCALTLEAGKKYIKNNLDFNFYRFRYSLIPKFLSKVGEPIKKEVFKKIERRKDPKFGKKDIRRLTDDENEVLELMSEQENYLNNNFMFYEAPRGYDGSEFRILLYMEDILPSRLQKLFDTKREVDKIEIFKECMVPIFENKKKTSEKVLEFNFGILRTFFPRVSNNRSYDKYFLDITSRIFTNRPIDYDFLMNFIMQRIRNDFINNYLTKISTLRGFMLLNYLNKLNLLKEFKEGRGMDKDKNKMFEENASDELKNWQEKIDSFFKEFADFFDSNAKKAVFLEGVLVQKLLNIQRLPEVSNAQLGKEPFRPRLKGLKLDEKQIKKILPEIQNKLEEYGKNYYKNLESIISEYFCLAGDNWEISNAEISFYFVLGMNLAYLFRSKKEEEKENGDE